MLRSHSQVLYSYLPGAVFRHEARVYGKVVTVDGDQLNGLNEAVLFDEIATYLERWPAELRHHLPLPRDARRREYRIIRPDQVRWEIYPLVFECRSCGRVRSFRSADDIATTPRCRTCRGSLQQLRFYNAHNCGQVKQIYVPKCAQHGYDDITFDNTGSFLTATWRCKGAGCNGGVVSRTNMSPCNCKMWPGRDNVVRMRAHTLDDSRAYNPHYIDLVNIDSVEFQSYQQHPERSRIAVAHYLGLIGSIKEGVSDSGSLSSSTRMTHQEWANAEQRYRAMGLDESEIAVLRKSKGPADSGIAALTGVSDAVLLTVGGCRPFYERAAVYDTAEVPRVTLAQQRQRAVDTGDAVTADAIAAAETLATDLGIAELAVTWEFPIAKVAFGFSREDARPEMCAITGFFAQRQHDGKYPVYAVSSTTEALLVTLSAREVIGFLHHRGEVVNAPVTEQAARRELLEIFAAEDANPQPAATVRVLVHTLAHLLLRGLDDGQIGFAEASLAEWLVPQTLTFAVYANTLKSFTLGSLWTLLNNRALSWLRDVIGRSVHCDNDPICYQGTPRSCERCSYLTFGCREFNDGLDRAVVFDYMRWRGILDGERSHVVSAAVIGAPPRDTALGLSGPE